MKELDVLRAVMARSDNYAISSIKPIRGRLWDVVMDNEHYDAVVLVHSFEYYEKRYHVAAENFFKSSGKKAKKARSETSQASRKPTLIICFVHDTVVPIPVLSMRAGNYAKPYELPTEIDDIEQQRWSKLGSQVLLGMYISGVRLAQTIMKELPVSTRNRYLQKVEELGRRKRGRPVGV